MARVAMIETPQMPGKTQCSGCSHWFEVGESMHLIVSDADVVLGWFCHECVDRWAQTGQAPWWTPCSACGQVRPLVLVGQVGRMLCEDCAGPREKVKLMVCQWCGRMAPVQEIELTGGEKVRFCAQCVQRVAQE